MRISRGLHCLPLCFAVLWFGAVHSASAEDAKAQIKIDVESIQARYAGRDALQSGHPVTVKMDPQLNAGGLSDRLRLMFDYSEYHLVRHQTAKSTCGGAVAFNLPGGHILHVAPLAIEDGELAMDLAMFAGARMIMRVPFRLAAGGMLMLVDQHTPNRFYITAISAESPQLHHDAHLPPIPMPTLPPVEPMPIPAFIPPW